MLIIIVLFFLLCVWWNKNTNSPAIVRLLVMGFLNINDASWGEGNWNKMGFVVDNLVYNVDWIWLC